MTEQKAENPVYPSIVFEVGNNVFSVNSSFIESILRLPECSPLPDAQPEIKGMFHYRDSTITMFDLRKIMKMTTREADFEVFVKMIDARKQEHTNWVNALEQTAITGEPFRLATDFHKCALGQWCDSFQSEIAEVNFQIGRITAPHSRLHRTAAKVQHILANRTDAERHDHAKAVVQHLRETDMTTVLALLEETKHVFHDAYFHEMALVLSGKSKIGLVADKILSVEDLSLVSEADEINKFLPEPYIKKVQRSDKIKELILELDIPMLFATIGVDVI